METLSCANLALVWKGLDIGALNLENMLIIAGFFSVASWWFFAPICMTPIMLKFGIKAYTIDFRKHANLGWCVVVNYAGVAAAWQCLRFLVIIP